MVYVCARVCSLVLWLTDYELTGVRVCPGGTWYIRVLALLIMNLKNILASNEIQLPADLAADARARIEAKYEHACQRAGLGEFFDQQVAARAAPVVDTPIQMDCTAWRMNLPLADGSPCSAMGRLRSVLHDIACNQACPFRKLRGQTWADSEPLDYARHRIALQHDPPLIDMGGQATLEHMQVAVPPLRQAIEEQLDERFALHEHDGDDLHRLEGVLDRVCVVPVLSLLVELRHLEACASLDGNADVVDEEDPDAELQVSELFPVPGLPDRIVDDVSLLFKDTWAPDILGLIRPFHKLTLCLQVDHHDLIVAVNQSLRANPYAITDAGAWTGDLFAGPRAWLKLDGPHAFCRMVFVRYTVPRQYHHKVPDCFKSQGFTKSEHLYYAIGEFSDPINMLRGSGLYIAIKKRNLDARCVMGRHNPFSALAEIVCLAGTVYCVFILF